MVDQIAVDDRFAIRVAKDRLAEDVGRVQRGRGGEGRSSPRQNTPAPAGILEMLVVLSPEREFGIGHLPVEQGSPRWHSSMTNKVRTDRRRVPRTCPQRTGHASPSPWIVQMWTLVSTSGDTSAQPLQSENLREGLARHNLGGRETRLRFWWAKAPSDPRRSRCGENRLAESSREKVAQSPAWSCRCLSPSQPT